MRLLDSCGWIYFFGDAPLAPQYGAFIEGTEPILLPSAVLFEVHCWSLATVSEDLADIYLGAMQRRCVLSQLGSGVALLAAELRIQHRIPALDSLIYAHAQQAGCVLMTSDEHLRGLPGVDYHATPGTGGTTKKAKRAARRPPIGSGGLQ